MSRRLINTILVKDYLASIMLYISVILMITSAYTYTHIYLSPSLMIRIGIGFLGGLIIGLYAKSMKETIVACFLTLISSIALIIIVLSLPVIIGIINEPGLANIFLILTVRKGFLDIIFLFPSIIIGAIIFQLIKEHTYTSSRNELFKLKSLIL